MDMPPPTPAALRRFPIRPRPLPSGTRQAQDTTTASITHENPRARLIPPEPRRIGPSRASELFVPGQVPHRAPDPPGRRPTWRPPASQTPSTRPVLAGQAPAAPSTHRRRPPPRPPPARRPPRGLSPGRAPSARPATPSSTPATQRRPAEPVRHTATPASQAPPPGAAPQVRRPPPRRVPSAGGRRGR